MTDRFMAERFTEGRFAVDRLTMATHHPHSDWLLAYASGKMTNAHALATAAHLSQCRHCQQQVAVLQQLGGNLLEETAPVALAADSWQKLSQRLDQNAVHTSNAMTEQPPAPHSGLPAPLHKLLPYGLPRRWQRISTSVKQATLQTLPDGTLIALHHIRAGGRVPQHSHDGVEITLVLNGSFSDQHGLYRDGDFLALDETVEHTPIAAQNEDCLCLTVQAAPIRLTGPIGRWFNPLIRLMS